MAVEKEPYWTEAQYCGHSWKKQKENILLSLAADQGL